MTLGAEFDINDSGGLDLGKSKEDKLGNNLCGAFHKEYYRVGDRA